MKSSKNICDQRTSIYLGMNKKRSKQYFRSEYNKWNVFKLVKDVKVLEMNPILWNKKKIELLIRRAMRRIPDLKEKIRNTPNFGRIIDLIESITGRSLVKILTYIIQLIFGIGINVSQQLERLEDILGKKDEFELDNKKKYGWTATPSLVKIGKTSLLDYLEYYLKNSKKSKKYNQRLSYFGFDTIFLLLCCSAGYDGYYYPNLKSKHEDSGEELAIFKTPENIKWIDTSTKS